ncbi:Solute carrier family 25 member 46 [Araneus ventricosus]|uniref:Solute carrier family 25 member 46 n=1 Tax=Araneus ventricosus TaxID=182803 RepID=A0A4Y2SZ44_ARAVE|nr:Solute carrier family 25 member 46 [Araneus ventricosus]
MSSKVPVDLMPISEEGPSFIRGPYTDPFGIPPGDFKQPTVPTESIPENFDASDPVQKFAGIGLEIASVVIGNVISHPCIVIRRQCQVNRKAAKYHLSPFTLIPVLMRLHSRQGVSCLWKGCSGIFILRGCSIVLETFLAEATPFPREVFSNSSLKQLSQHLLLKLISFGILTPFYCASLVETVQSDIASEKPGVLDCLKEGVCRLLKIGTPRSTRLLPMWQLVGPTAVFGLSTYVLSSLIQSVLHWFRNLKLRNTQRKTLFEYQSSQSSTAKYLEDLSIQYFSSFIASIVMYPAETMLHRLYLQGTRTIIDDLDSGTSVLPVISTYEGFVDCFHTIVNEEGASGLYKGFGALLLEYAMQALLLKAAQVAFREIESMFKPAKKPVSEPIPSETT